MSSETNVCNINITRRPWENGLNWIPDPAPTHSRDHGKQAEKEEEENRPPTFQPPKLPRKIRPRRRKREHRQQHLPSANRNSPGIDLRPREMRRTPVSHSQPLQHPQHPRPAANENLSQVNLPDQADHGRLYKQAPPSRVEESTNDLVETTSPGHLPPSALSGRVETTSLGRPHTPELAKALTQSFPVSHGPIKDEFKLTLKEELSPSYRAAATRCLTTCRLLHEQPSLTQSLKWDLSLQ